MKRIIDKETTLFLRDDTQWNEKYEIALDVEPDNDTSFVHPKWDGEKWIEGATEIPTPQVEVVEKDLEQRVVSIEETLDVLLGGSK